MKKIVISYVPVLHKGHIELFRRHTDANTIGVLGSDVTNLFRELVKDVRALDPELVVSSMNALNLFCDVSVFSENTLRDISKLSCEIVMPDDAISKEVARKYFSGRRIIFEPIFLRWDRDSSMEEIGLHPDHVSDSKTDLLMMNLADRTSNRSSDWWRRVGAVFVRSGNVLMVSYNRHLPTEHTPYIDGDPRASFHRGDGMEYSTAIHAEANLVGMSARNGISLSGGTLYITTFPCQTCAKLISTTGIEKICYRFGYAVLDGERVLKDAGIRLVHVPK